MKSNLTGRMAALLSIAFFMAISITAFPTGASGQKSVPLATTRFNQLLTAGDAGTLRSHLLKKPGATLGRKGVSETHSGTFNKKAVTVEIASQFINTNEGEVEQVTILVNEDGQATTISLVQDVATGNLNRIRDGVVQAINDAADAYGNCVDHIPPSCDRCEDQLQACSTINNVALRGACYAGRLFNPVGACVRCNLTSAAEIYLCLLAIFY